MLIAWEGDCKIVQSRSIAQPRLHELLWCQSLNLRMLGFDLVVLNCRGLLSTCEKIGKFSKLTSTWNAQHRLELKGEFHLLFQQQDIILRLGLLIYCSIESSLLHWENNEERKSFSNSQEETLAFAWLEGPYHWPAECPPTKGSPCPKRFHFAAWWDTAWAHCR